MRYAESQKSKGFGYVDFVNEATARRAVEALNGRVLLGRELKVEIDGPKAARGRTDAREEGVSGFRKRGGRSRESEEYGRERRGKW
jgi:RNA recognition motif-containing protein